MDSFSGVDPSKSSVGGAGKEGEEMSEVDKMSKITIITSVIERQLCFLISPYVP